MKQATLAVLGSLVLASGAASAQATGENVDTVTDTIPAAPTSDAAGGAPRSDEDFQWYTPDANDARLPIPMPPPPPPAPVFVEVRRHHSVAVGLGLGHYFLGQPQGVDTDISVRIDASDAIGFSLSLVGPDPIGMLGLDVGRGYGYRIAKLGGSWVDLALLLPTFRFRAGTDFRTAVVHVGGSIIGLRLTTCERFRFDIRLNPPDAWLSWPNLASSSRSSTQFSSSWGATIEAGFLF